MQSKNLGFSPQNSFSNDGTYFEAGQYVLQIVRGKLNKRGEPYITFKVVESHHDRRINMYYGINFSVKSVSEKASHMWKQKLSDMCLSVDRNISELGVVEAKDQYGDDIMKVVFEHEYDGATQVTPLDELRVCMVVGKDGMDPLPNFQPAEKYDPEWQPRSKRGNPYTKPTPTPQNDPLHTANNTPSSAEMNAEWDNWDDEVPF